MNHRCIGDLADDALDRALDAVMASVRVGCGARPTVSVEGPAGDRRLAEQLVTALARRAGPRDRALFSGSELAYCGVGVAHDDDVRAADRPRRRILAQPFPSSAARPPRRTTWAPRVFASWAVGGPLVFGADLGVGPDERDRTLALVAALRAGAGGAAAPAGRVVVEGYTPSAERYRQAIEIALERIREGSLEKVVIARRHRLRLAGARGDVPLALFSHTPPATPAELRFLIEPPGATSAMVGLSPELLCRRRGRALSVDVLAGTSRAGDDALLVDDKERREHEVVRRFVLDALAPVAVQLEAPAAPGVRVVRHLQHLHTPVRATLASERPVFELLHPTPAVAGVPRAPAIDLIRASEGFERGLYGGVVGLVDAEGEDLWVALRCAEVEMTEGGALVDLYAGAGVVLGSEVSKEWRELDGKEGAMRAALDGVLGPSLHGDGVVRPDARGEGVDGAA